MISSREILDKTGIKAAKTLTRWHQRGLIPEPEIGTHPNGRGKIAYWPDWVLGRIGKIREMLSEGQSLDQIRDTLGSDWEREARRWDRSRARKRRDVKETLRRLAFDEALDNFADAVAQKIYRFLRTMGIQRPGIYDQIEDQLLDERVAREVLESVRRGYNPVLVLIDAEIKVTTDFVAGAICGGDWSDGGPVFIVPIRSELLDAFSEAEMDLPPDSTVRMTRDVEVTTGDETKVCPFHASSFSNFEIEDG